MERLDIGDQFIGYVEGFPSALGNGLYLFAGAYQGCNEWDEAFLVRPEIEQLHAWLGEYLDESE